MLILLVGPKRSGKSHIGRVLQRRLGVCFFHVEPHWLAYHEECRQAGREPELQAGMARVHPQISLALQQQEHVCVETTGTSPEILAGLLALAPAASILKVRVSAPLDLCLQRVATRDSAGQIPMDSDGVRRIHELSLQCTVDPDLRIDNQALTDEQIVASFLPWRLGG